MVWTAIAAEEECKGDMMNLCQRRGIGATANTHFKFELGSGAGSPSAPSPIHFGLDHNSETPQTGPCLRPHPRSIVAESSALELVRAMLPASTQDPPPPLELQMSSTTSSTSVCVRVCVSSKLLDAYALPPQTLRVHVIINGHKPRRPRRHGSHGARPCVSRHEVVRKGRAVIDTRAPTTESRGSILRDGGRFQTHLKIAPRTRTRSPRTRSRTPHARAHQGGGPRSPITTEP